MEFPQVFVFSSSNSEDEAGIELARKVAELEVSAPFVLMSRRGMVLAEHLKGPPPEVRVDAADQQWAHELGSRARRAGADAIVSIGGGRCLDVGKLAAVRAGLNLLAVPTQLSHDGICSPVAVVPNERGRAESVGAIPPAAAFISIPTLMDAPWDSARAGVGDLLANPLALRDWALATERGLEQTNERAWELSVQSFDLIQEILTSDAPDPYAEPQLLERLADALVLSGMAMICAGTSRPASGGEHEISHAIDAIFGGRALHGAQVAFGCILSAALYGEDTKQLRERLRRTGLPQHPSDLGFTQEDVVRLLLEAPNTRPGRFTIIEEADLDARKARAVVKRIWDAG